MERAELDPLLTALLQEEGKELLGYFKKRGVHADDALQETMARALASATNFEAGKKLAPWVWGIAANVVLERRRKAGRGSFIGFVGRFLTSVEPSGREMQSGEVAQGNERERRVREALDELPEKQRIVIELSFFRHLSHSEIAEALDWSLSNVKKQMTKAYAALAEKLEDLEL